MSLSNPGSYFTMYTCESGIPLLTQEPIEGCIQLTVPNHEKWYALYLLHPDGQVERIPVSEVMKLVDQGYRWVDHNYHPKLVHYLAEQLGAEVPPVVMEVIIGRWVRDQRCMYDWRAEPPMPDEDNT